MSWDGQSRGTVTGYKTFLYLLKLGGSKSAYFAAFFIALYYYIFFQKASSAQVEYFRDRLGYGGFKARIHAIKNFHVFAKTILDRMGILSKTFQGYVCTYDGRDRLEKNLGNDAGLLLISTHMGNFEIAGYFLNDFPADINVVSIDQEVAGIKEYFESISTETKLPNTIYLKKDGSHIFEMAAALRRKECVCVTGDRFVEGGKTLSATFLGKEAKFPSGPFEIASRLDVPVAFCSCMKGKGREYHFYGRIIGGEGKSSQEILEAYISGLEEMIALYPLQWFNFYKFWQL